MSNPPRQDIDGCEHHPEKCCECMLKEIDEQYLNFMSDEEKHLNAALFSVREVSWWKFTWDM